MKTMNNQHCVPKTAVTLLSGGLDSLVATVKASECVEIEQAITFSYGQRAHAKEIDSARLIARYYGWPHRVIELPDLALPKALQSKDSLGSVGVASEVVDLSIGAAHQPPKETRSVWVPNRNGVFLNMAAAVAEAMGVDAVVFGANAQEAETFPDNTTAFTTAITQSLAYSTLNQVQVLSPVVTWQKAEMIAYAIEREAPLHVVWSCYEGEDIHCGVCSSCQLLRGAIAQAEKASYRLSRPLEFCSGEFRSGEFCSGEFRSDECLSDELKST